MAKFVTYYNLCPIPDTTDFQGVSKDRDDGNILSTLGRSVVIVLKISTQKQIHSWTVLDKLSSKVLYDPKSEQYVGVFGNKSIRCWQNDINDLNKVRKQKFNRLIAELVSNEDDELLVLYNDGTCEKLSSALAARKEPVNGLTNVEDIPNNIWDPKVFSLNNGQRMLTYFLRGETNGLIELVTIILDEQNSKPLSTRKFRINRGDQNVNIAGYSVIEGSQFPSLLTIWSDKRLFTVTLNDTISQSDFPGNFVSVFNILKVDSPLSILGISRHCIAIYGANSAQEGASLILYNTQFKVVQAKQFFKIYFNFSRLWSIGNNILLAMGQNLSVVSFRMSKQLLSELIGTQVTNDFQHEIGDDFINEEDELEESLAISRNASAIRNIDITDSDEKIVQWADGRKIPFIPIDTFDNEFNGILNYNVHVDILKDDQSPELSVDLMTHYADGGILTKEIEIIAKGLERCGCSEHEISEKLLTVLIKADLVDGIATCLRRYTNISEKMLAKTLKYAVSDFNANTLAISQNTDEEMEVDLESTTPATIEEDLPNSDILLNSDKTEITVKNRSDLINIILSCSFDEHRLSIHIRNEIDIKEALLILEHLFNLISTTNIVLEERSDFSLQFNDDLKILQWFGIFLTTHFQKLALSKDVHFINVLVKWHEILNSYKKELVGLDQVAAQLYSLVDKKKINKEKNYSKWYSIEEVRLY